MRGIRDAVVHGVLGAVGIVCGGLSLLAPAVAAVIQPPGAQPIADRAQRRELPAHPSWQIPARALLVLGPRPSVQGCA